MDLCAKRDGDRIVAITWTMEIKPGEFAEFSFLARNPKEGAQIVWKVRQRYTDGTSSDCRDAGLPATRASNEASARYALNRTGGAEE